ncbi:MAG: BTAD domain-containing putative transcriptional regulator, partial [Armatimonadota bacterium]
MMNGPWKVTLFGGLCAQQDEQAITRFKTQKVAALFAYLAYHLHQTHSREFLIEMLWPESDTPTLRNSLSVALSSLRNQFEPPGVPQGTVLCADRFTVGLNPASIVTDVGLFEEALNAAAAEGSRTGQEQRFREAVNLYRGPLLPGLYDGWIAAEQERLSGRFFEAVGILIRRRESVGDIQAALSYARQAVAADPHREDAQHLLIRLLDADGQPGPALRQYRDYEQLLLQDEDDEPSPALKALFQQIEKGLGRDVVLAAPARSVPRTLAPVSEPQAGVSAGPATLTFLISDLADSVRLSQETPEAYSRTRDRQNVLLKKEFTQHGGRAILATGEGDSFLFAFPTAGGGIAGAVAAQKAWTAAPAEGKPAHVTSVRMALHTGDVIRSEAKYYEGPVLHYVSRMLTAAQGGQVLVSEATAGLLSAETLGAQSVHLSDLGVAFHRLRDVPEAKRIFQAKWSGMVQDDFGPLTAEAGYQGNLPLRLTRFFGQEVEIAALTGLVTASGERLVTLTGPGGTG